MTMFRRGQEKIQKLWLRLGKNVSVSVSIVSATKPFEVSESKANLYNVRVHREASRNFTHFP